MNVFVKWLKAEPVVLIVGFGNAVAALVEGFVTHQITLPVVQGVFGALVALVTRSQVTPTGGTS